MDTRRLAELAPRAAAFALPAVCVLSLLLPAGRDFWYHNFAAPVLADVRGEPVDGVGATYNPYNTLAYGVGFYLGFLGVNSLLARWRITVDGRFVMAAVPLVVLGGVARTLEDAGQFNEPVQYLFISPLIYFALGASAVGLLALGAALRRRTNESPSTALALGLALLAAALAGYGAWWLLVSGDWVDPARWALLVLATAALVTWRWGGRPLRDPVLLLGIGGALALGLALLHLTQYPLEHPAVIWRTLGVTALLTAAVAGLARLLRRWWSPAAIFATPTALALYAAHFVDGVATWIGIEYHGYLEKHVVPDWFIAQAGTAAVMLPLKFVVVTIVVWLLARAAEEQPEQRGLLYLLTLFLLTLGLAPGIRDILRLALGV